MHDYWSEFRDTAIKKLANLSLADLLEEHPGKQSAGPGVR